MKLRERLVVFTDKFPLIGPTIWMLCVQYFIIQIAVAAAWTYGYSWRFNVISDLGNTGCGHYSGRFVCSPLHELMNTSFVLLGLTMLSGAGLIYQEFKENRISFVGFTCMGLAGLGSSLVGLFPENTVPLMHAVGAILALGVGNIGIGILSVGLQRIPLPLRMYTLLTGVVTILAFCLFIANQYLGLGQGGMERLASYPQTVWLIFFGLYMTKTRLAAAMKSHHRV